MITITEIEKDFDKLIAKVKLCTECYSNNDIWMKLYGNLISSKEMLKKDAKIYGYK